MRKKAAFVLASLLGLMSTPSSALTGNELNAQLTSSNAMEVTKAYNYIFGVFDAEEYYHFQDMMILAISDKKNSHFTTPHFCTPKGMTNGQAFDIIRKYFATNPENRHLTAHGLIREALIEVFPCADNAPK